MPALYDMLIACDDRIGWSRDGRAIEIPDIDLFTFVLVAYFPKLSLTSWRRCMLSYGFRSNTSRTTGTLSLSHPTLTRASKRSDFVEAIQAPRKNPPAKRRPWSRSSSVLSSPLSSVSGSDSEAGDDEVETMVDDTFPQAGPSTSIIRDRDSFLVKLFRLCEDHTNAAVLRWDNHGRVVIRDPERLPGLLQLQSWAPRPRTFGGICREFFRHGFVLIPLRDKYRIPSTVFYAWSHPILDADYPMDELARLSAADAWQLAADEMDGDADGDVDADGEGEGPMPAFKMEGVEMLASPDMAMDMDMDLDTEPPPPPQSDELETASNDSSTGISDSSTSTSPPPPPLQARARCKCKGTPSLGAGWINFGGRVRCLGCGWEVAAAAVGS
ncbi:HSF-DOMAIN domain-containing protein [Mycena chlorophos]|uniref:HSF-DOMAIN domain-containing protein n=1 Tax=Mycena chlorophos TaxID=658473 RepID=A0A8H6SIY5_MYCCL|nr:HSF-DOMAIN domain-containing protein [Mycena chlorophos]